MMKYKLSAEIDVFPIVNKSLFWSLKLNKFLLEEGNNYDCIAVELPSPTKKLIVEGIKSLPEIKTVTYLDEEDTVILIPIDPCEPVINAVKYSIEEKINCEFVDSFQSIKYARETFYPNSYALNFIDEKEYFSTILPTIIANKDLTEFEINRYKTIAGNLFNLSLKYKKILYIAEFFSFLFVKEFFHNFLFINNEESSANIHFKDLKLRNVARNHLFTILGELPLITYLYISNKLNIFNNEEFKYEDVIKKILINARYRYIRRIKNDFISITKLNNLLRFARNFALRNKILFPDLYTLVYSAKKVINDDYAYEVMLEARNYPYNKNSYPDALFIAHDSVKISPDDIYEKFYNYFDSTPRIWREINLKLKKLHKKIDYQSLNKTKKLYNTLVSYPPEDIFLETTIKQIKEDVVSFIKEETQRIEKFSGSLEDGINLRETLRNLNQNLYVNINTPSKTYCDYDITVVLFDQNNDQLYPEQMVMHAEHHNESTIAFYSTPFMEYEVKKGIYKAMYGGIMLIYPPRFITDFWKTFKFPDYIQTLADKLVYAAAFFAKSKNILYLSYTPPTDLHKFIFQRFGKKPVYHSLKRISPTKLRRLKTFHLLKDINLRKIASDYINLE